VYIHACFSIVVRRIRTERVEYVCEAWSNFTRLYTYLYAMLYVSIGKDNRM
jgi:hypothetical protein